jgi:hypothetical protein
VISVDWHDESSPFSFLATRHQKQHVRTEHPKHRQAELNQKKDLVYFLASATGLRGNTPVWSDLTPAQLNISLAVSRDYYQVVTTCLEPGINVSRSTTLGRVTGDIEEITFFLAFRTGVGGSSRGNQVTTLSTFPVGQTALWADIPGKLTRSRISTHGTYVVICSFFHFTSLLVNINPSPAV